MTKVVRSKFAQFLMVTLVALAFLSSPMLLPRANGDCPGGASSCGG